MIPLYHLRSLTIQHLTPNQEEKVHEILAMKSGDIYDGLATDRLYHAIGSESLLSGCAFGFSPKEDPATATVDLTLNFYRLSDQSAVRIK
ncbi:MAG: hypothetical protein WBD46_20605 [Acidobacteriaceae bacterium]